MFSWWEGECQTEGCLSLSNKTHSQNQQLELKVFKEKTNKNVVLKDNIMII